jgi:hypothetical protein
VQQGPDGLAIVTVHAKGLPGGFQATPGTLQCRAGPLVAPAIRQRAVFAGPGGGLPSVVAHVSRATRTMINSAAGPGGGHPSGAGGSRLEDLTSASRTGWMRLSRLRWMAALATCQHFIDHSLACLPAGQSSEVVA